MNYKEALDSLKFEVYEECHCSYIEQELDLAIKALEKQVPKKPKHKLSEDYCFNCGKLVYKSSGDYCSYCGHAIDWK